MQRLEPILKSWLIWLILAASAVAFAALVVTDGDAHAKRPIRHPKQTSGHRLTPEAAWDGQIAYAVPRRGANPTAVEVATSLQRKAVAVYRAPDGQVVRGLAWRPTAHASPSSWAPTAATVTCSSWT